MLENKKSLIIPFNKEDELKNKSNSQQGGFSPLKNEKRTITGIYSPAKSGDFGFVDVEGEQKGYYVHGFNKKDALPGDKVLAELKSFRGKDEAVILEVLERSDKIFIGHFQAGKKDINKNTKKEFISFGFVVVRDQNFKTDIFVPGKYIKNAKNGNLVGVKIISWENKKNPKGEIIEVLGDEKKKNLAVDSYILESGFKQTFPREIEQELKYFSDKVDVNKELKKGRNDLSKMFTFTIDGEDAKDLDDAISIEKIPPLNLPLAGETSKNPTPAREVEGDGFILYVHIADVANYIEENGNLDKEAIKRATSVYLADRVIPMLPEKLSNNLCSLNPNTPKLVLTCEMVIGKDGVIKKSKVYESIIESNFRLTYKEVDEILSPPLTPPLQEGDNKKSPLLGGDLEGEILFSGQKITKELIEKIKIAEELKLLIEKNRKNIGVLDFDFPETKVLLDEQKNVLEIKQYPRYKSNKMIELFMVSANNTVSKLFSDLPFLHRIHPKPSEEDIAKLQTTLNLFNIDFVLKNFDTKEFSKLLEIIEKDKNKDVLEKVVLRSLTKAIYSDKNEGHFGLGLDYYSHFTSPIRRYPDLQIHRIIKERLNKKLDKDRIKHYENILKNVADKCSLNERKAEKLEYKVRDYYVCKYYESKVGEEFDAKISGLIPKGFFVMLEDTSEGFIAINPPLTPPLSGRENRTDFIYNEELMHFEDRKNKIFYKLADTIKVKLIEVDLENLRLNFEIV